MQVRSVNRALRRGSLRMVTEKRIIDGQIQDVPFIHRVSKRNNKRSFIYTPFYASYKNY